MFGVDSISSLFPDAAAYAAANANWVSNTISDSISDLFPDAVANAN